MATKVTRELLYAVVGAGDLAIDKVKGLSRYADRKTTQKYYRDLVERGESLTTSIRTSRPTKRAATQTKAARSQVKAAGTSVSKAVRANARAGRSAASKTARSA